MGALHSVPSDRPALPLATADGHHLFEIRVAIDDLFNAVLKQCGHAALLGKRANIAHRRLVLDGVLHWIIGYQ